MPESTHSPKEMTCILSEVVGEANIPFQSLIVQFETDGEWFTITMPSASVAATSRNFNDTESWILGLDWSKRDPRLDDFPLMSSLGPVMGVVTSYIVISGLLIRWRSNEGRSKPFFQRWVLVLYNFMALVIYTRILALSVWNYRGNSAGT